MIKNIVACRPVDLDPDDPTDAECARTTAGACAECKRKVWIGPRSQAVVEAHPDTVAVMCFLCAVLAADGYGDTAVASLGNEETRS